MVTPTIVNGYVVRGYDTFSALFRMIYTYIAFRLQQLILKDDIPKAKIYRLAQQRNVLALYFFFIAVFAVVCVPIAYYAKVTHSYL